MDPNDLAFIDTSSAPRLSSEAEVPFVQSPATHMPHGVGLIPDSPNFPAVSDRLLEVSPEALEASEALESPKIVIVPANHVVGVIYSLFILRMIIQGLLSDPLDHSVEQINTYGLKNVSGFYGPGSWAAWLLTLLSCCLNRLFRSQQKRSHGERLKHAFAIDLDLVAAFGYPLIASVDLILRLHSYRQDTDFKSHMACMAAAHAVIRVGTGPSFVLALLCFVGWINGVSRYWSAIFGVCSTMLIICANVAFDLFYFGFETRQLISRLFLRPRFAAVRKTRLYTLVGDSGLFVTRWSWAQFGYMLSGGSVAETSIWVVLFVPCMGLLVYIFADPVAPVWLSLRKLHRIPWFLLAFLLVYFLSDAAVWASTIFITYIVSFFLFQVWFVSGIPPTMGSIMDLDQMSVLLLSGVLVVANTGIQISADHKEFLITVRESTITALKALMVSFIDWFRSRWSREREGALPV